MSEETTKAGFVNENGQVVIRNTKLKSTTHYNQTVYQLGCSVCGHIYGANGCDLHIRNCPVCDSSAAIGEPIRYPETSKAKP